MISWTNLLCKEIALPNSQSKTLLYKKPQVVVWNITSRCNLHCRHCYFDATHTQDPQELTCQEAKDFIKDLADLGVGVLLFSGGEPLLRKDIFELAGFAKDKGIKAALSTNGTLISPQVVKKIKDAGFSYVGISLDGKEKVNDWFRKKSGAFRKTLTAIKNCQKKSLKVGLRFTLTKYNFKDLPAIFDLVERESIARLCLYHLVYTGRAGALKNKDLAPNEKRQILEFIWRKTLDFYQRGLNTDILTVDNHTDGVWIYLKLKRSDPKRAKMVLSALKEQGGNSSGIRIACVDNRGNIYPDQFWKTHCLGNLRQRRFSEVWQDKGNEFLLALRNRKPLLKGRCQGCKYICLCNGNFRRRAEAVFADPWQEDPACYLTDQEIAEN